MIADDGSSGEAPAHVADTSDRPAEGNAPAGSRWGNGLAWLAVFGVLLLTSANPHPCEHRKISIDRTRRWTGVCRCLQPSSGGRSRPQG
jgi:hypothetical protein